MKMVTAVIRPHALEVVRAALHETGINGLTVSEVRGYGRQKGYPAIYRGSEYKVAFQAKIQLELAVEDSEIDQVTEVIVSQTKTGKVGDGKVFVTPLEAVIRIRTRESSIGEL